MCEPEEDVYERFYVIFYDNTLTLVLLSMLMLSEHKYTLSNLDDDQKTNPRAHLRDEITAEPACSESSSIAIRPRPYLRVAFRYDYVYPDMEEFGYQVSDILCSAISPLLYSTDIRISPEPYPALRTSTLLLTR